MIRPPRMDVDRLYVDIADLYTQIISPVTLKMTFVVENSAVHDLHPVAMQKKL